MTFSLGALLNSDGRIGRAFACGPTLYAGATFSRSCFPSIIARSIARARSSAEIGAPADGAGFDDTSRSPLALLFATTLPPPALFASPPSLPPLFEGFSGFTLRAGNAAAAAASFFALIASYAASLSAAAAARSAALSG